MRVIVVQKDHKLDSSAAEEYGTRHYILDNFADPFDTDQLLNQYRNKLKEIKFNPKNDVVCLTGPSILLQLLLATIASRFKKIKVLMFYAPDSKYKLRELNLEPTSNSERNAKPVRRNAPRLQSANRKVD